MNNFSFPLSVLVGGLAFAGGFVTGTTVFRWALRRQAQRVALKLRAIESARLYLHERGVELAAWVADLADRERADQQAEEPRSRWWKRWLK
ncbi:hypothetical protein [Amycolatopsis sp. H20-H5]|uniref:hypothetical protein n=1 Tax=Amycolatopsis sp. H20-H5 TaxID=3046309 RepID=UPI002DBED27D|nr:hypothetical protein [Amycolatopsis sp. H20-H5]MEC3976227.1 hypothetical protein [Amycolatopsis sp. H20-H5]